MPYTLHALISREDLIQAIANDHPEAVNVPLDQKLAMIPNTDAFYDAVRRRMPSVLIDKPSGKLWKLSGALMNVAVRASVDGPIAYVEADYAGGKGSQASIVWKNKKILFGPHYEGIGPLPGGDDLRDMPINSALRILGAQRGQHKDTFEALGLAEYQRTEEWAASGLSAPGGSPRRLTALYPIEAAVEVRLSDGEWHHGRVARHDHPGLWVEIDEGAQWFVTNGRHIRPLAQ
jgi:hypothetical protein